jgi:hypothetical protein
MHDTWSEEQFFVDIDEPTIGLGQQHILYLDYSDGSTESEQGVCNHPRSDGVVCRLWVNHPGPHIPFSVEVVHTRRPIVVSIEEYE